MEENKDIMNFTYTSKPKADREEVKNILQQYIQPQENLMKQLRKLDEKAKRPGIIISIIIGVLGTLTVGTAISLILLESMLFLGIIVGILGIGIMGGAYPTYMAFLKKGKAKYGVEIRRLSEIALNK